MTATKFNNRLMTAELREALSDYPLYSQDAKGKDALCIAVFHLGNIRWYIMEGQPEGDDFTLYGIVWACRKLSTATCQHQRWPMSLMMRVSTDLAH